MSDLELDHLFCFCSKDLKEPASGERAGFKISYGVKHEGQGTANRCMIFNENYFEFIFMDSESDALKNPLRLDRRANWQTTKCSPFGVALRGTLTEQDRRQFWQYNPPYFPTRTILIHKSNETNLEWPLLFVMPLPENSSIKSMHPINSTKLDPSLLQHPNGATKIDSVEIAGPNYNWPITQVIPQIALNHADSVKMNIFVNSKKTLQLELNNALTVKNATN